MNAPTIEELTLHASKIGLPDIEAQKFAAFYESKGWRVGKNPMQSWKGAMAGWKLRWQQCQEHAPLSNMDKLLRLKELERIEANMKAISGSYSENMTWESTDRLRYKELKARQSEILRLLGMSV